MTDRSRWLGALCGLSAAISFGVAAPLSKLLLREMPALLLAGLLYLGAGLGISVYSIYRAVRPASREAGLQRTDLWKLALVALSGGMLGPVLMLIGLRRLPAVEAALLLNLEAPLTILLSLALFGEHLGRRAAVGSGCILLGGALLQWQGSGGARDALGLACLIGACACWALDNNLTQRLSLKDPFAIVRVKALTAGLVNTALGYFTLERVTVPGTHVALAMLLGSVSYGMSVVLDTYALRLLGAAREAAYFATAPFVGALLSVWLLDEPLQLRAAGTGLLMAVGVLCLLYERHSHTHTHEPLQHDHVHTHDAHHQHAHADGVLLHEPHAHPHQHTRLVHDHPHVSDEHHRHKH